jgi:hypothetical protein
MGAVTDNRVTAAIATARATLKSAVNAGAFGKRATALKKMQLSFEVSPLCEDGAWIHHDQYDDERAKTVIAKAMDGDVEAAAVLHEVVLEKLRETPNLAEYIGKILDRGHSGRRGTPQKYYTRDAWVYLAVEEIKALGFNVMRNSEIKDHESACSIVAAALAQLGVSLSEKSIERIWTGNSARYFCPR